MHGQPARSVRFSPSGQRFDSDQPNRFISKDHANLHSRGSSSPGPIYTTSSAFGHPPPLRSDHFLVRTSPIRKIGIGSDASPVGILPPMHGPSPLDYSPAVRLLRPSVRAFTPELRRKPVLGYSKGPVTYRRWPKRKVMPDGSSVVDQAGDDRSSTADLSHSEKIGLGRRKVPHVPVQPLVARLEIRRPLPGSSLNTDLSSGFDASLGLSRATAQSPSEVQHVHSDSKSPMSMYSPNSTGNCWAKPLPGVSSGRPPSRSLLLDLDVSRSEARSGGGEAEGDAEELSTRARSRKGSYDVDHAAFTCPSGSHSRFDHMLPPLPLPAETSRASHHSQPSNGGASAAVRSRFPVWSTRASRRSNRAFRTTLAGPVPASIAMEQQRRRPSSNGHYHLNRKAIGSRYAAAGAAAFSSATIDELVDLAASGVLPDVVAAGLVAQRLRATSGSPTEPATSARDAIVKLKRSISAASGGLQQTVSYAASSRSRVLAAGSVRRRFRQRHPGATALFPYSNADTAEEIEFLTATLSQ